MNDNNGNLILVDRKYAKTQLRHLVVSILGEQGLEVRTKRDIKVAYPGEGLEVGWIQYGFNDDESTYRVYFETSKKTYNTEICLRLDVKDQIYDKNDDRVYDRCVVKKCEVVEYHVYTSEEYEIKRVDRKLVQKCNEECIKDLKVKRRPIDNKALLTCKYGEGNDLIKGIVNRVTDDVADKFGVIISKDPELIINDVRRAITKLGKYTYYAYTFYIIKKDVEVLFCEFIFKSFKVSDGNEFISCMELDEVDVSEYSRLDWSRKDLCNVVEMEEYILESVRKYCK